MTAPSNGQDPRFAELLARHAQAMAVGDYAAAHAALGELLTRGAADPFADRFRFLDEQTLLVRPLPRPYLLWHKHDNNRDGMLPRRIVGMLVASGGVGKTMVLCQLALAVAVGRDWLGHYSVLAPGPVLLALAEEDEDEVRRRLYAAAESLGLSRDERILAASRIVALPLAGTNVALTSGDGRGNVQTTPVRDQLRRRLESMDVEWRLIVLDPLSRWAGNDVEKDNHAATRFIEVAEELTTVRGRPTVLLAHHTNKNSRQSGSSTTEASRGATALTDGARWVANLESEGPDAVIFKVTKSNYAPWGDPVHLLRDRDCSGALRPMSAEELEAHKIKHAERVKAEKDKKAGKPPVSDEQIDARIFGVIDRRAMSNLEPLSKTQVADEVTGERKRVFQRIGALIEQHRIVVDQKGRLRRPDRPAETGGSVSSGWNGAEPT